MEWGFSREQLPQVPPKLLGDSSLRIYLLLVILTRNMPRLSNVIGSVSNIDSVSFVLTAVQTVGFKVYHHGSGCSESQNKL